MGTSWRPSSIEARVSACKVDCRDSFTEALRQATQLKFNEVVNILRQRGVTLPDDSG
jgi:hypothetical protein